MQHAHVGINTRVVASLTPLSQVARCLHYLGDHILTLTRMNLRDYLQVRQLQLPLSAWLLLVMRVGGGWNCCSCFHWPGC